MWKLSLIMIAATLAGCCTCPPANSETSSATPSAQTAQASGTATMDDRPTGEIFKLRPGVWDMFKEYRDKLTPGKDEYFAAASDGAWAWEDTEQKALSLCQEHSTGPTCILFAKNAKILVPYRIYTGG